MAVTKAATSAKRWVASTGSNLAEKSVGLREARSVGRSVGPKAAQWAASMGSQTAEMTAGLLAGQKEQRWAER